MRALRFLPLALAAPLVLGAWASSRNVTPNCTVADRVSTHLVSRGGYNLACGPGAAVVKFEGNTYRISGSRCFISSRGARLYFGAQRLDATAHPPPPRNALYLVVEPNRGGQVPVLDGGIDLAPGPGIGIRGTAQAANGLRQGTFTIHPTLPSGKLDHRRFTGSWNCG